MSSAERHSKPRLHQPIRQEYKPSRDHTRSILRHGSISRSLRSNRSLRNGLFEQATYPRLRLGGSEQAYVRDRTRLQLLTPGCLDRRQQCLQPLAVECRSGTNQRFQACQPDRYRTSQVRSHPGCCSPKPTICLWASGGRFRIP